MPILPDEFWRYIYGLSDFADKRKSPAVFLKVNVFIPPSVVLDGEFKYKPAHSFAEL